MAATKRSWPCAGSGPIASRSSSARRSVPAWATHEWPTVNAHCRRLIHDERQVDRGSRHPAPPALCCRGSRCGGMQGRRSARCRTVSLLLCRCRPRRPNGLQRSGRQLDAWLGSQPALAGSERTDVSRKCCAAGDDDLEHAARGTAGSRCKDLKLGSLSVLPSRLVSFVATGWLHGPPGRFHRRGVRDAPAGTACTTEGCCRRSDRGATACRRALPIRRRPTSPDPSWRSRRCSPP